MVRQSSTDLLRVDGEEDLLPLPVVRLHLVVVGAVRGGTDCPSTAQLGLVEGDLEDGGQGGAVVHQELEVQVTSGWDGLVPVSTVESPLGAGARDVGYYALQPVHGAAELQQDSPARDLLVPGLQSELSGPLAGVVLSDVDCALTGRSVVTHRAHPGLQGQTGQIISQTRTGSALAVLFSSTQQEQDQL